MSNFMANYEDVNSRIERFKKLYPQGSILTFVELFQPENGWILIRCEVRKNADSVAPDASDIAFGDRNLYPKQIARFYCEDVSTSAQGRALNAVIPTNGKKPTLQDMEKTIQVEKPTDPWATEPKEMPKPLATEMIQAAFSDAVEVPNCKHGPMRVKEGTKNNRAYHGYICPASGSITDVCEAIWYQLSPSGKWIPPKPKDK